MKNKILYIIIIFALAFSIIKYASFDHPIVIGLFSDQKDFITDLEGFEKFIGRSVEIKYYNSSNEIHPDIVSGKLDIFCCSPFELIKYKYPGKAVAATPAEYYLIGYENIKSPEIGVSEYIISPILISIAQNIDTYRANSIKFNDAELKPFLMEKIIHYGVFRSSIKYTDDATAFKTLNINNKDKKLKIHSKMSDLGYTSDVMAISNEHLIDNSHLVEALFKYSNLAQTLPPKEEIDAVINYLFKNGLLKKRIQYNDIVYQ